MSVTLLVIPIWFFIMVTALCRRVDSFAPYGREASTCKQRNTMISVVMRCETWIVQKAITHKSQAKKHLRVYSVVTFSILREANRSSPRPSVNVAVIVQVLSRAYYLCHFRGQLNPYHYVEWKCIHPMSGGLDSWTETPEVWPPRRSKIFSWHGRGCRR